MEVHGWKKEDGHSCSGFMVIVNEVEAMELAHNLLHQILQRSCNSGRLELRTKADEYFSITVHSEKDVTDDLFSKLIV